MNSELEWVLETVCPTNVATRGNAGGAIKYFIFSIRRGM